MFAETRGWESTIGIEQTFVLYHISFHLYVIKPSKHSKNQVNIAYTLVQHGCTTPINVLALEPGQSGVLSIFI